MRGLMALVFIGMIVLGVVFMGGRSSQVVLPPKTADAAGNGDGGNLSVDQTDEGETEPEVIYVEDELVIDGLSDPEIRIDFKNLKSIEAPMEKSTDASALNGFSLTVPEAPNNQTLHEADRTAKGGSVVPNGKAVFEFNVETEGEYILWAHKRWGHSCADSFRFSLDNGPLLDFISDSNYGVWEWATLPKKIRFKLGKGSHTLTIANREDGFRIDSLLLTTGSHEPVSPSK